MATKRDGFDTTITEEEAATLARVLAGVFGCFACSAWRRVEADGGAPFDDGRSGCKHRLTAAAARASCSSPLSIMILGVGSLLTVDERSRGP